MAGKEEEEEAAKWMLRPCTAGGGGEVGGGTKRKAVARFSYKEGDPPPEGWIDVYALSEPASFDPFGSHSRAAAIDKLLQDAVLPVSVKPAAPVAVKPAAPAPVAVNPAPAAAATAPGGGTKLKRRLTKGEIMSIIALKPEPFPSADYLDELAQFDPPESIAERRQQHEEDAAYFGDMDHKYESFRQQVIKGLKENGYYEVDEDYVAAREKANQRAIKDDWNPFGFLDPSELQSRFATPEDHQRRLRQGFYRRYVPDAEDALLISYGDDDDADSVNGEEDDGFLSEDEEDAEAQGADAHKGPPTHSN